MRKWNYTKQEYEPYNIPENYYCPIVADMDERVNCPSCGRRILYGDGFTSRVIHGDKGGMGYTVCSKCHNAEVQEEMNFRNKG